MMKNQISLFSLLRRLTSILLLVSVIVQIVVVLFLAADFDEFEIDEIHEVSGYVLLGLMLIHTALYFKNLKSMFGIKTRH
jgi:hypothetical protein